MFTHFSDVKDLFGLYQGWQSKSEKSPSAKNLWTRIRIVIFFMSMSFLVQLFCDLLNDTAVGIPFFKMWQTKNSADCHFQSVYQDSVIQKNEQKNIVVPQICETKKHYFLLGNISSKYKFGVQGRIRICGFLCIFTYTDKLFQFRLGYSRAKERPSVLATVKIRRNPQLRILPLILNLYILLTGSY